VHDLAFAFQRPGQP